VRLPIVETSPRESPSRPGILSIPPAEVCAWLAARGEPAWRYRQIHRWLVQKGACSFAAMTDLPQRLRQELEASFVPLETRLVQHFQAADQTHKLVLGLRDGALLECVLIQEAGRRTACISTQVGCGMGCVFCASGLEGLARNLTGAEMLEQLLRLRNLPPPGESGPARLTHLVVMGMGEPLANLEALQEVLEVATAPEGLGISARHVTISTVGLPARIRQLADLRKQYHLAVSLHAPTDALRSRLVPINARIGLAALLAAADYYFAQTGRQVTFEYVLLRGINDGAEQAQQLADLLRGRHAHVNLIPFNDVDGLPYRPPTVAALQQFVAILRTAGLSVKVRKRKGSTIDAACGQLRRRALAAGADART
jgi:23S rRNA (adenine2503-C2)-methyltransferase